MCNQNFLQNIISQIKNTINQFAFNKMTATGSFDPEETLWEMRNYGDETLGECINRNLLQKLFTV